MVPPESTWERRHPPAKVDPHDLQSLLGPDVRVLAVVPLDGGLVNTMLRLDTSDGPLVFRKWSRGPGVAAVERAIALDPPPGVPIPRWRVWGDDWAVMDWVDGVQLVDVLAGMASPEALAVGRDAGATLAALHRRTMPVAGALDEELQVPSPFASVYGAWDWAVMGLLDGPAGDRLDGLDVRGAWTRHRSRLRVLDGSSVLCHGDYKPENLRVNGTELVAVLDWEFAFAGPALCDVGQLLRSAHLVDPAWERGVELGYRDAGGVLPEDWRALGRLLDLHNLVRFLKRDGRPTVYAEVRERIRHTLAALG